MESERLPSSCHGGTEPRLETGHFVLRDFIPLDARSHHSLNYSESVHCAPQPLSQSTRPFDGGRWRN